MHKATETMASERFIVWFRQLLLSAIVALPPSAFSSDFSQSFINPFNHEHEDNPYLLLKGEIVPGDYERLLRFAINNNIDLTRSRFILWSPGGDVSEGLKIGNLLKHVYATVAVGPVYGQCASACFIIFASAVERASGSGLVGIHRPYVSSERLQQLSPSQAESLETRALEDAERYLHELRVPTHLVDAMFENASTEIHWLSDDELDHQLGRRPPWYEELLIARCGLDKSAEAKYLSDPEKYAALYDGLMNVFGCGKNLTRPEATQYVSQALRTYQQAQKVRMAPTIPSKPGPNSVPVHE